METAASEETVAHFLSTATQTHLWTIESVMYQTVWKLLHVLRQDLQGDMSQYKCERQEPTIHTRL